MLIPAGCFPLANEGVRREVMLRALAFLVLAVVDRRQEAEGICRLLLPFLSRADVLCRGSATEVPLDVPKEVLVLSQTASQVVH